MRARWQWALPVAAAAAGLPFAVGAYRLDVLIFLVLNVIVAASYRLIALAGEWSLGHVVTMGVGAYASALLAKKLDLSVWLSVPAAGLVAAALAYVLSFPLFRLKGFYFLIGSFAAGEAIRLTWYRFRDPFGGPSGITRIPALELALPGLGTIDFGRPEPFYFLALAIAVLSLVVMYRLEASRLGLTLRAIHWRDVLAESVGVDARRFKTTAFVIASFFAALAGALLAHYLGTINPAQFGLTVMLYLLVWVIVGGTRTFAGPIIGTTVLTVLDVSIRGWAEEHRPAIYGVILIVTILFLPTGLEGLPQRLRGLWERRGRRRRPAGT
jgi:branched-chain amino acid transport system permease protein